MRQGHIRVPVKIPTGGSGLSEPVRTAGYRVAAIEMPSVWTAAAITFRGRANRYANPNGVANTGTAAGLAVDANAQDIQMTNAVKLNFRGGLVSPAKVDPIDISAVIGAAATIDINDRGVLWVFQKITGAAETGVIAVDQDKTAADYTSAIEAWAQYAVASRALPPSAHHVPIGAVFVNEGGSGSFTWGTDSITAEAETYHDFIVAPEMLVRVATLALDGSAPTFTYGASGVILLGDGTRVTLSGKANVTIAGSNVADGKFGAWLFYALADDVEIAVQLGNAYGSQADAQGALDDHVKNPYLALFGTLIVENQTGANFVPGTTNLDDTTEDDITTTFEIKGPVHKNLFDDAGTELSITAAVDQMVELAADLKENIAGAASLQFRSGTSGTPVDQTTSPTLQVILEPV